MTNVTPQVLILDDEPLVLRALSLQLDRFDFEVDTSEHHQDARERLAQSQYDVLICDNNMPGISGTGFLESIAGLYPNMLRFMLTGSTPVTHSGSTDLSDLGVVKVFRKPCNVSEIVETIHEVLDDRANSDTK